MDVKDIDARGKGMYLACIIGAGIIAPYIIRLCMQTIVWLAGVM